MIPLNTLRCGDADALARGKGNGGVVAQRLAGQHRQRASHWVWVDLTWHDRAARLIGRQADFGNPARGPEPNKRKSLASFISTTTGEEWFAARQAR